MKSTPIKKALLLLAILFASVALYAQPKGVKVTREDSFQKTRILFILDCSNTMYGMWQSNTKIKIAQNLLSNIVDTLANKPGVEMALRAYGHTKDYPPQNCDDTRLEVGFYQNNTEQIKAKLKALVPKGTTPIAYTLEKCVKDFPESDNCRNIVVLITDGVDECSADVCKTSKQLQKKGAFLKPFIIGIGKGLKEEFECAGSYFEVTNEIEFSKALNNIVAQVLNNTTSQVNLLDSNMEPSETNVPMTFYDAQSKQLRYTFMHTFNSKGLSDTLILDPLINYDIVIHTLPPVKEENVQLKVGRHTIIPIKAPQGNMMIKLTDKSKNKTGDIFAIVRESGKTETVNIQALDKIEKYLVGKYDLEILTLPKLKIENVEVGQSSTTTIEIPVSGTLSLTKGKTQTIGSIFVKDSEETKWVCNLEEALPVENIELLPGQYMVVLRDKNANKTSKTQIKEFKIESNKTTTINLAK
ncbi:MAG: VWA domain-containing protein [Bacteroidales bacterium]|nr:VWA domain-containing protein [Bacteroidales bacterium]